ncbi:hypothetical protein C8R45DRAFT_471863 [Mycena sanguinolenta]|nr:hypothetical protein C8R45DRAFT_471863 [Mycena sanguinolenta]
MIPRAVLFLGSSRCTHAERRMGHFDLWAARYDPRVRVRVRIVSIAVGSDARVVHVQAQYELGGVDSPSLGATAQLGAVLNLHVTLRRREVICAWTSHTALNRRGPCVRWPGTKSNQSTLSRSEIIRVHAQHFRRPASRRAAHGSEFNVLHAA